jgi:aminopeptidase N
LYYDKTSQVLASLRSVLGEEAFHNAFREYGRGWIGKHPYPYDFFNAISQTTGRDLSWFWSSWVYEAWPMDQAIESVSAVGDSAAVVIEDRGLAPMPVLVAITRADGTVQRVELPVDAWLRGERRQTLRVSARPSITRVEIDPDARFPDIDRRNQVWTPDK